MSRHRFGSRTSLSALSLVACLAAPAAAALAQGGGPGKGFLLGTPVGSLSIRAGYDHATAGSDIFTDPSTIGKLTLSKGDFSAPSLAADIGVRISDRLDFVLGSSYAGNRTRSHYRDFTETVGSNQNAEIEQTTTFQRVPITGSLKLYLTPRGRSIGKFAWVPSRLSPYLGGGGGFIWYRFQQQGDFVDFNTPNTRIFTATFESSNWTGEAHAFGGLDYTLNPRLALTAETRYTWGRAGLSSDYAGFQRIDLSGLAATAGLTVRF
ncbi:hypothetical protein J421_1377 [Gemmatirosa kalamazoonensis]|uniref:Outer membrane protein beta-barrel domain-containing protein n=1 Tax=Gemmatirosa kalamazoonensis TaxID=861299 RepID=W0RCS1_9BACT|nr:outer membrane beta-barrel protein [Gemmatirosa kalamazoonensis]AHG88914.1 hypothetical protein J421_1377 [Gemmatirosa kalamazoonensis]